MVDTAAVVAADTFIKFLLEIGYFSFFSIHIDFFCKDTKND
jgi:hypothetical protein